MQRMLIQLTQPLLSSMIDANHKLTFSSLISRPRGELVGQE